MLAFAPFSSSRILLIFSLLAQGWVFAASATAAIPDPAPIHSSSEKQLQAVANYGKLPLSFEPNQGQTDPSVKFVSRGSGYALFLTNDGAVLALGHSRRKAADCNSSLLQIEPQPASCEAASSGGQDVVRMTLAGAASPGRLMQASGEEQLPGKVNYFLGNDPMRWHTDLPTYARVRYSSVYPGVDLVYYGNQRQLEYDFVVAPGAESSNIRLQFAGANSFQLHIAADGDLVLRGANGEAVFHKPVAYQEKDGRRQLIPASFHLAAATTIGFSLGAYDHNRPLIIDPVLTYSTYLGGSGTNGNGDQGNGITVDSASDAYVVGTTYSTNFPVTPVAFQSTNSAALVENGSTVFITELNPAGTALVYSTYLGGTGTSGSGDFGYGIALDSANNVYVTGATYSTDFPVTCGAFLTTNPSTTSGAPTAFVAELSPTANALVYSTYLGGSGNGSSPAEGDVAQAIAVDGAGDAFVTGYTYSTNFPVTDKAFQAEYAGTATTSNAFVTKLNPGGTALLYSTYLGGSGGDYGNSLAIDASGDAFVAGGTASSNFPTTKGAFQGALLGPWNGFVTELNPAGADEVYSTYLGGSGQPLNGILTSPNQPTGDSATAIAVDSSGFAYVAGNTSSSDFPVTPDALEGAGDFDAATGFVTKLSLNGSSLVYSTYLEGAGTSVSGLAVDSSGTAYVTGNVPSASEGLSAGFQATADALPSSSSGGTAAFLVKLSPSATVLNYATLIGGASNDAAIALALDAAGNAYLTGVANSTNFPTTSGIIQPAKGAAGVSNAFVSKFALAKETNQTTYPPNPSNVATTITSSGQITLFCDPNMPPNDGFTLTVNVNLNTDPSGPPPTGIISFTDDFNYYFGVSYGVSASWGGGGAYFTFMDGENYDGPDFAFSAGWQVSYSGDAYYGPSSSSGSVSSPGCPSSSSSSAGSTPAEDPRRIVIDLRPKRAGSTQPALRSTPAPLSVAGPKFTPRSATAREAGQRSQAASSVRNEAIPSCPAPAATPEFSPPAGAYTSVQSVTISDSTPDAAIYYTTDLTKPTTSSTMYTGAISVSTTEIIRAIAVAAGYANSAIAEASYTLPPPPAAPVFSPAAGTYTSTQSVTISDATAGTTIYYTTDGTTPTTSSTMYTGAITVSTSETLQAIAVFGGIDGAVTSGTYTILPKPTFGSVNVGSSSTATIAVTILNAATLGSFSVLTQGAANLDFTNAGGGNCTLGTAYTANATCTVDVAFTPKATGTRYGAAVLYDNSGNVIGTGYVQGTGSGPQVNFLPGTETTIGSGWNFPACCLLDESGNLYLGNNGQNIEESPSAGGYVQSILNINGRSGGFAIDGAGDFYISTNSVDIYKEVPLPGGGYAESTFASGLSRQNGAVVDGSGNLYVADALGGRVLLETLSAGTYTQSIIYTCGTVGAQSCPSSVAVDGSDNLYVSAYNASQVLKLSPSASGYTQSLIGSGFDWPSEVVVDGNGNLYIADTLNSQIVKETLSGGSYVQSIVSSSSLYWPWSAGVDWSGNVYINDNYHNRILKEDVSDPPTLSFAATKTGLTSSDSPKIVTIENNGNTPLNISAVSYPADFPEAGSATGDCKAGTSLQAGATCTLTIDFTPVATSSGSNTSPTLSESVTLTTNTLNAAGTQQAIAVTGTETLPQAVAPVFTPVAGAYTSPQSVTITDATTGATIYYTTNGSTPTTSSTLYTGPITVSSTETIEALATAAGFTNSAIVSATYTITPPAATPVFSPAAGTYTSAQSVTISDATMGAAIYYTTNGSMPTTSSTLYTGAISVSTTETIQAIAVATGYTSSAVASATYTIKPSTTGELQFVTITPCRIADTRNATGAFGAPELAGGSTRTFNIPQSSCGIPSTAVAYSLNATVVPDAALGYLIVWPAGEAQPPVSTLNSDGRVKANATITAAGADDGVSVYTSDPTQFILDIDGYFVPAGTSASGLEFYPVTPCRIADTRNPTGALGGPFLTGDTSRDFPVQSSACGIPATAKAYSLNITAVPHGGLGYLTAWPSGQTQPEVSTLNATTGAVTANAAIVPAGTSGEVSIYASDDTDVILDVNGYFAAPGTGGLSLYTVTACRVIDTRDGAGAFDGVLTVPVETSVCAAPATAHAYVLNATVVPPGGLGYMSLWAAGTTQPDVSTLNASDGAITSNMAIVPTVNGSVDAFSSNPTQLILDLSGYFAP